MQIEYLLIMEINKRRITKVCLLISHNLEIIENCISSLSCTISIYAIWEGWMRRTQLIGSCTHSRPRSILEMDNEQGEIRVKWGKRSWKQDRKSTRLNSSHSGESRMPSSA